MVAGSEGLVAALVGWQGWGRVDGVQRNRCYLGEGVTEHKGLVGASVG